MISFDAIAVEMFQILRSFDHAVEMYDDEGNEVYEPEQARRLFAKPENLLISIVDAGDNSSVRMYLGKRTDIASVKNMLNTARSTATKYNMIFNVRKYDRELEPSQFATRAAVTEDQNKESIMNLLEGMYGTTKSSYLKMENARMIVRHSKKIDENIIGSRGRHIDVIFCETSEGERFRFPTRSLAPARAMTQHLNHGGAFADAVGQQITRMAQDYSHFAAASQHVAQNAPVLAEGAVKVRETCREKMREMRRCFERLSRVGGYVAECKRLQEMAESLNEGDGRKQGKIELGKLKSLLTCEGVDLDEAILESVASIVDECDLDEAREQMTDVHAKALGKSMQNTIATTHVLGQRIGKDTWAAFCKGSIELSAPAKLSGEMPHFTNKTAELNFLLSLVVPLVKDDMLAGLLSYVSEELQNPAVTASANAKTPSGVPVRTALRQIAEKAISSAGLKLDANISANNPVVKEFSEWLDGFKEPIAEDDMDDEEDAGDDLQDLDESNPYEEDDNEEAIERVMDNFDASDFLDSDYFDADSFGDEKVVDNSYLVKMISRYLSHELETSEELYDIDCDDVAVHLVKVVDEALQEAGWTVQASMSEGVLSREDVLIPSNMGDDLEREVTPAAVHDPVSGKEEPADAAYIDRLRTLTGQNKSAIRYM